MLDHFGTAVRAARVVALAVAAAAIAGCGIKGPLRPATPPDASVPAPAPAPDQDPAAPRKP